MSVAPQYDPSRTIALSRLVDAPRDLVFKVFTQAKHIDAWWGPDGFRNETHEMGFYPGGLWRYTMHGPDGKEWANWIRYKTITPPELIVYDHGGEIGEPAMFEGCVELEAHGSKTLVTLSLFFPTTEARDATVKFGAVEGGEQNLARLAAYMQSEAVKAEPARENKPFIISRTYNAPRQLVFDCFAKVDHIKHWWGPKGIKIVKPSLDFRAGGMFHYAMQTPDGSLMWGRQIYREITPPSRIVLINSFSDEHGGIGRHPGAPDWPAELLTTFTFDEEAPGKTIFTVRWELMDNATGIERETFLTGFDSMTMGWTGTLDQLGAYLEQA
jgi:uncharacterized protein YndB with AHSA1/START domain